MFLKIRQEEGLLRQIRFKRIHLEAAQTARWVEGLVAKPGDLSSIPMTHQKSSDTYQTFSGMITSETSRVDKLILMLPQPSKADLGSTSHKMSHEPGVY